MSPAQDQALVLASICFMGSVFFVGLLVFSRGTRFSVFAALNLLLAALLFGAQVVFGFSGWRSQIVAASASELPVVFLISWVCLAQAGGLLARVFGLPAEPAARRPRLRSLLRTAPLSLLVCWGLAVVVGLVWPSAAMQAYAPAPLRFVLFKWAISIPEGFYAGLSALVFAMAARSSDIAPILRLKNLAFSIGMLCLALIALESTILAYARAWLSEESRETTVGALLTAEVYLAASCFLALALGLSLRYTPAVATTLLRRLHTGWLPALERLEAAKWRTATAGEARGMILASHRVTEAAKLAGLSWSETQRALSAVQLVAVIKSPSTETDRVTPGAARDLYEVQEEILSDSFLAAKVDWAMLYGSFSRGAKFAEPAPLHDALEAALDLVDRRAERGEIRPRPLWHHLVAVSAADLGLADSGYVRAHFGSQPLYRSAVEAYEAAKVSSVTRRVSDQGRGVDQGTYGV